LKCPYYCTGNTHVAGANRIDSRHLEDIPREDLQPRDVGVEPHSRHRPDRDRIAGLAGAGILDVDHVGDHGGPPVVQRRTPLHLDAVGGHIRDARRPWGTRDDGARAQQLRCGAQVPGTQRVHSLHLHIVARVAVQARKHCRSRVRARGQGLREGGWRVFPRHQHAVVSDGLASAELCCPGQRQARVAHLGGRWSAWGVGRPRVAVIAAVPRGQVSAIVAAEGTLAGAGASAEGAEVVAVYPLDCQRVDHSIRTTGGDFHAVDNALLVGCGRPRLELSRGHGRVKDPRPVSDLQAAGRRRG